MRPFLIAAPLLAAALILSGCVLPGAKTVKPAANPITGSAVTTQSLDSPPSEQSASGQPVAGQVDASQDAIMAAEAVKSAPEKPTTPVAADATPEAIKCIKHGGTWASAGKSGAKACVKRTKDAGKACTKETQCEGYCLARSRSCAPIKPMFGCTEILQADGREVTLCLD